MNITRREALLMTGAAALFAGKTFAAEGRTVKPLKVLILGGTGISGPHLVRELRDAGHQITLFNRGKRNPGLFEDIETLIGDRNEPLDALRGRDWDVVVDNSGYFPAQVARSTDLLQTTRSTTSTSRASPPMRTSLRRASTKTIGLPN
jgi:2'-hydroxyisoflavone reductase